MTRIDFYLTRDSGAHDKNTAVCKLTHKAFRLGHEIYILAADPDESAQLDRLLWTFNPGSFIPHGLNGMEVGPDVPVIVGSGEPPENCRDVLISLTEAVPDFFSRFSRVVDIVSPTTEAKRQARERFRFYRERGYPLQTHNL
ncbi:MAG: DNA polymerase III subunit chi [Acidiferrobacterales bacterium]